MPISNDINNDTLFFLRPRRGALAHRFTWLTNIFGQTFPSVVKTHALRGCTYIHAHTSYTAYSRVAAAVVLNTAAAFIYYAVLLWRVAHLGKPFCLSVVCLSKL